MGSVIIDHDVLRSTVLSASDRSFDEAARLAYGLQWALVDDMLKQGVSVIIDSTCYHSEVAKRGKDLADQHGYLYCYVELGTEVKDIELVDQRLRSRRPMASQRSAVDCPPAAALEHGARAGEDGREDFVKWMRPCRPDTGSCTIIVDATKDPSTNFHEIWSAIQSMVEVRTR